MFECEPCKHVLQDALQKTHRGGVTHKQAKEEEEEDIEPKQSVYSEPIYQYCHGVCQEEGRWRRQRHRPQQKRRSIIVQCPKYSYAK